MKYLILLSLLISANANAEKASWTGKFEELEQGKENVMIWGCEYKHEETVYKRAFENFCPIEIEVTVRKIEGRKVNVG